MSAHRSSLLPSHHIGLPPSHSFSFFARTPVQTIALLTHLREFSLNDTNVRPTLPHTTNPSSPLPPNAPPPWIDLWLRNTRHVLLARCRSWRMQHLRQASTSKHTSFRREKWPNSKGPVPSRWRTRIRPALRQRLMSSPRKKSLPARTWKPSKKFAALASALKNTRVRAEVGQPRPRTIRRRALAPAKKPREEGPRAAATAAAVVGE